MIAPPNTGGSISLTILEFNVKYLVPALSIRYNTPTTHTRDYRCVLPPHPHTRRFVLVHKDSKLSLLLCITLNLLFSLAAGGWYVKKKSCEQSSLSKYTRRIPPLPEK